MPRRNWKKYFWVARVNVNYIKQKKGCARLCAKSQRQKTDKKTGKIETWSYISVIPLIRRGIIDFLIKILGTIPQKSQLPVLSPKNRLNRKFMKKDARPRILCGIIGFISKYKESNPKNLHFRFYRRKTHKTGSLRKKTPDPAFDAESSTF